MTIDWHGLDSEKLAPGEHDRLRLPKAEGPDWVMIAPECFAVGCRNGRSLHSPYGLCIECGSKPGPIKIKWRWRDAEPHRFVGDDFDDE